MNEELKALLKEAYDRGATREQLDAITERYNASKKKDEAIPSPSLDGESVSPEIDYGTEDFKQVTGVTAQVTQENEPSFFQPAYDAADWINKNIPLWSNWASVSTGMTAGILKYADGLAKEASLFFMPDSEMKDSIKKQIEEKGADEVLDTPWEDFTKGLSDYSGEIKKKRLLNQGVSEERQGLGVIGNIKEGNIGTASALLVDGMIDGMLQSAVAATTGIAPLAVSAAGEKYGEIAETPGYSSGERVLHSTAVGMVEGMIEKAFAGDINVWKKALDSDKALKGFEDELMRAFKNTPLYKDIAKQGLEEGFEEALSDTFNQMLVGIKEGEEYDWTSTAESFLIGMAAGGGSYVATSGMSARGSEKRAKRRAEIIEEINKVKEKSTQAQTASEANAFSEMQKDLTEELNEIRKEDAEFYGEFSKEDITEVIGINQEIRKLSKKYNLADSDALKKKYADEIKILRDEKQNIENKYSETPTRYIKDGKELSRTEFVDMLNAATAEELATGQWGVQNDEEVEQLLTSKLPKDDSQKEERIPSPEQEAEAPVEAEPVVRAGEEEVAPDRDVQEVEEKVTSGEEVFSFVEEITPQQEDVPTGFEGKIKERDFRESEVDLQGLLNTDPDFKEFYDNFKQRYEEGEVEPEGLGLNLVVVDGELLDGYNRAATLLSEGQTKTNAFTAVEKAEPKKAEPKKATPFVPEDVAEIQPQDVVTEKDNEGNSRFFARIPVKDRDVKAYFEVERKDDGTIVRVSDKSYGLARKTLKKRLKAEPSKEQIVSQRSTPEYVEAKVAEQPVEDPAKFTEELQGQFGLLTAENPMAKELSEEENAELNKKAEAWLKERNYSPRKVSGRYEGIAENSFFVPNLTMSDAIAFAKEFNQDSVAHSEGLVDQQGKMYARVKSKDVLDFAEFQAESDFVSTVNTAEGAKTFEIGYNFEDGKVDAIKTTAPKDTVVKAAPNKKLQTMVSNFNKVIKKIGAQPYNITFAANNKEYEARYRELTGKEKSANRGTFIGSKREIIINLSSANEGTLAHEMMHAYLHALNITGKNILQLTNALYTELSTGSATEKQIARELRKFQEEYIKRNIYGQNKTFEDPNIAEEFLTEYVGIMVQYSERVPASGKVSFAEKIRRAVLKFLTKLGIKDKSILQAIETREEAVNFINGFVNVLSDRAEVADLPGFLAEQGKSGEVGTIKVPTSSEQIEIIDAPKASEDSRSFIRNFVTDIKIKSLQGRKFVTNMYDYTNAGITQLGKGLSINLLGGRNYVPLMMERTGKKIGEVSNLAAFNTKDQAEGFIRNAKKGKADLFAPHSGTLSKSWQFQHNIFQEMTNLVLENKILSKSELIDIFNEALKSKEGQKQFKQFNDRNGTRLKNFNSFKKDPMKLVELLDAENNYSPELRKALNDKIAASKKVQKALGIKNKQQFQQLIADPMNQGIVGGEIMTFVEFDPKTFEIVKTKQGDLDHHPSFGWTVKAKIKAIYQPDKYYKSYDLTNEYTKYNTEEVKTSRKTDASEAEFIISNVNSSAGAIPKVAKVDIDSKEQIDFAGIEMKVKETPGNTDPAIKTGGTAYVPVSTLYNLMDMRGGDRGGLYETAEDKKRVQNLVEAFKKEGFEYKGSDALYVDIDADGYGWIGEGNHRVLAARELGMSHLPVRVEFGAARDGKFIYDKNYSRVPTQVVTEQKIEQLKEQAGKYYHIKYASIWETNLPTNQEPSIVSKEQIDFEGSEMINEFSWTEEVVDPKTGKLKTINRTEKSDKPIGIKFPDGTVALVRSFDTELKEAQQLLKEVKKGTYPYMDEDQVEYKIDLLKKRIKRNDVVVELIDGDMKYHKTAKYGRSAMPMGSIELSNNHYNYYFPKVAKLLGKDHKAGLMYSPDNTRGTDAVEIYDEFQGKGFGSRLYFAALRLLREQVPGARLISNHDFNVKRKAKNFWRSQVNNGLARVIANTATKQEIEQLGGQAVLKQLKDIGAEYTGDIYELLDPTERTAPSKQYDVVEDSKEQIDWQRSEFGRGQVNPAIVNRATEVQQAAVDLLEGKITNKEYQDTVKFTQTIEAITRFFLPASTKDMKESLDSNKAELLNTPIEDGKEIGLRLDIPAYKNKNIWIVSVHDKGKSGKSISYGSVAWATDVNFGSNPKVAAFIAAGRNMDTLKKQDKTTIARMLGKWKNFEGKTKEERDAAAVKKVEEIVAIENKYPGANRTGSPWRQIGMNPFRHSFFYDRRNGKPVVSASEVVQIGGLVYAKDVKYANWSSDQFTVDGYYDADGAPVKFQVETQTDKKLVDALEKGEIPAPLYKKSLGEKIYAALFRTPLEMEILKLQEKKDAKISDLEYQGREIANRIKRYAKTPEALKLANEYLTKEDKKDSAEAILKLPNGQKLLDNLRTARGFIDNISSQLANDPAFEALPDELRLAISENITTYLRAQYKFFTDKSYDIDKRRDPAIQAQFNELVAREIAMLGAMGASDMDIKQIINDSRDDIIEEATQMIDSYISDLKEVKYQPSTTGAGIKMPNAPFRAKKDLPQYIKELLGEEKNPVNRFAQTTKSLANVLYKGEMINGIIELVGKDSDYILDEKPEAIKEKQYVKVSDPYSMLDGKYVHKEVMDMVNQKPLYTTDNFWANIYFTTLKLARKSKVIWNITTWRKNLTGGWYFIMANGVANPGFAKDFARRTKLMFNVRGEEFQVDEETKQLMRIMAKTGLTGKSIDANLIGISQAAFQFGLDGDENAYYERAKKVFNNIAKKDKWLQEKYAAVDDYTKLIIFRSEIQSYAKKLYGKAYDQLTDTQKDNVHDQAAERVKQSTPTFSRLPKWYPKVAVIPVVGDFISFRLESLRSYGENVGNAVSDIKKSQESGLDEVQKKEYLQSGLRRLAGSGAVFALKLGITIFLADLFLDDDDEELEEDAKVLRPEWMDGQTIIPRSIDKDGNVRVYNYSSEDPYGDVSDIFGGTESWSAMIKDFVRPNIAANLIFNLSKGEDIYGGKIADYSDSEINNMIKVLNYTAKQIVVPPTVSSSFRDAYLRSELPKKDKIVNLATTIAERSVIRDYKYNIVDSFVQDLRKIGETRKSYYDYDNPAKRLKQLDEIKEQFDAIVRIGVAKNNFELIDKAQKYMKRHLESLDEEYVLDGIIIKKQ